MPVELVKVKDQLEGEDKALKLLKAVVDNNTLLLLSGGSSPMNMYKKITQEKQPVPGAAATADERYGDSGHEQSNEKAVAESGLYKFFGKKGVEIHKVLNSKASFDNQTKRYEAIIAALFSRFSKKVAIMGVGEDGHTAGIAPNWKNWINPVFLPKNKDRLVVNFENPNPAWNHAKRITITPKAIGQLSTILILAFGEKKKDVLETLLHKDLPIEKFPAMIYKETSAKTVLVTDSF